jgi:hypothetical protein
MLQQHVTAFPRPDLDESCSLQLANHLGPGHLTIVNLPLGFVNAASGGVDPRRRAGFSARLRQAGS